MHPRRWAAASAALAASACLCGCSIDMDVTINPDDTVSVEGVVWDHVAGAGDRPAGWSPCDSLLSAFPTLRVTTLSDPTDDQTRGCHLTGVTPLGELTKRGAVGQFGDTYVWNVRVSGGLDGVATTPDGSQPGRLSLTFPGTIEAHDDSGVVEGDTVTWDLTKPIGDGTWVVARRAPDVGASVAAGLGGALLGGATAWGALAWRRRVAGSQGTGPGDGA